MEDKKLDDLKMKLDKGTAESKEDAFVTILKEYGDQPDILELVTNKLIKLRSYNAFFEIMKTSEVDVLDKKRIYLERLKSKDHRIRENLLNQFFVESFSEEDEVVTVLTSLINSDPHYKVRSQAYTVLTMNIVENVFSKEWLDHCINLAYEHLSEDYQDNDSGLWDMRVFRPLGYLPFNERILNLMERELTINPISLSTFEILAPARNHPEQYKSIIPVFKKVISHYLDEINSSFFGGVRKVFLTKKNANDSPKNDSYTVNLLCVDMLQAYRHDADLVNYLYDLTVKLNNLETRLTKRMIGWAALGDLVDIDFSRNLLERYIKNQNIDLLIRYYATEDLRKFYKRSETPDEPTDLLNRVLKMVSDAPQNFKQDVTNDIFN